MSLTDKFGLILLGLTLGAQVFRRSFFAGRLKSVFRLAVAGIFGSSFFSAFAQYRAWQENGVAKFFLPPYQGIGYFLSTVYSRMFAPWLLSLIAAILASRLAGYCNRRFGERFFESEEIPLMALAIFLVGYPGFLFYIACMTAAGFLLSAFYSLFSKGRAPLYYLWLPMAIFVILIKNWLIPQSWLNIFVL